MWQLLETFLFVQLWGTVLLASQGCCKHPTAHRTPQDKECAPHIHGAAAESLPHSGESQV